MTDFRASSRAGRGRRVAIVVALVAVGAIGGYLFPQHHAADPAAAPPRTTEATPTPLWTPTLSPHADVINDVGAWGLPQPGTDSGPRAVTAAGVPFGYAESDDGARLAAANAVIAGEWVTHTLVTPWPTLGFPASGQYTDPQRRANVASFLGGVQPDTPTEQLPIETSGGGCGCGVAVQGAAIAAAQPGAEAGYRTVDVLVAWWRHSPEPAVVIGVDEVLLHWEGDWRLADVARQPPWFPTATATLPAGLPTVAPSWLS